MKKALIVLAIIAGILIAGVLVLFCKEYSEVKKLDKTSVSISEIRDGVYEGACETALVKVRVKVTVKDGMIEDVEILEHQCGKGTPANSITEDIINRNDIEVDAVSGATVSSEVIKNAVRNALRKSFSDRN